MENADNLVVVGQSIRDYPNLSIRYGSQQLEVTYGLN